MVENSPIYRRKKQPFTAVGVNSRWGIIAVGGFLAVGGIAVGGF